MTYQEIHELLTQEAISHPKRPAVFFKTGPGQYAEHDRFLGVGSPTIHLCAKRWKSIAQEDLRQLIESPFNEERALALQIVIWRYQHGSSEDKEQLYNWYLANMRRVNNWNLVDLSAHYIVGAHLFGKKMTVRCAMARSSILWERRISIVSTWYDIRHGQYDPTLQIARLLLTDSHDLIHKAVGWMLREVGKRDKDALFGFLHTYLHLMPRTMLRYAIEKCTQEERSFLGTRLTQF